jgi:hypothetical protein
MSIITISAFLSTLSLSFLVGLRKYLNFLMVFLIPCNRRDRSRRAKVRRGKRGQGVARQYAGPAGKIANRQAKVGPKDRRQSSAGPSTRPRNGRSLRSDAPPPLSRRIGHQTGPRRDCNARVSRNNSRGALLFLHSPECVTTRGVCPRNEDTRSLCFDLILFGWRNHLTIVVHILCMIKVKRWEDAR